MTQRFDRIGPIKAGCVLEPEGILYTPQSVRDRRELAELRAAVARLQSARPPVAPARVYRRNYPGADTWSE